VKLTPSQQTVVMHFAAGKTAKGVGRAMGISEEAVKSRTRYIRRKLRAKTMVQAVARAIVTGAVDIKAS
jgi:DNA-binding NarL/FixJ family response regulator